MTDESNVQNMNVDHCVFTQRVIYVYYSALGSAKVF